MKTIIAGSRGITDYNLLLRAMERIDWQPSEIVSGAANGVDKLGERWAEENGVELTKFPAEWDLYGKAAGHIRNAQMAKYADAVIVLWDGKSRGASNMITEGKKLGLNVVVFLENELKNSTTSNPIKNNPLFGKDVEDKTSVETKTITLNGRSFTLFTNPNRNPPMANMIDELVSEVKKLKGE